MKNVTLAAIAVLLCWATETSAQNSSLLHAPMPTPNRQQVFSPGALSGQNAPQAIAQAPTSQPPPVDGGPGGPFASPNPAVDGYRDPGSPGQGSPYSATPPLLIDGVSWTYQPAPPVRVFRKHDVVTIRVDEITRMQAIGLSESRRLTLFNAALTDWIRLTDFRLRPDPQEDGEPTVGTQSNNNFRAQSTLESRESLTFNIAATIVDILPNGSLVLEARKTIRVNDNLWETSLSGTCRVQDIAPDNVVLSKDLIDMEIRKEDQGHLRDGYKRGWFQRWFDRLQPF